MAPESWLFACYSTPFPAGPQPPLRPPSCPTHPPTRPFPLDEVPWPKVSLHLSTFFLLFSFSSSSPSRSSGSPLTPQAGLESPSPTWPRLPHEIGLHRHCLSPLGLGAWRPGGQCQCLCPHGWRRASLHQHLWRDGSALPLTSCGTLDKSPCYSESQCPHL